MHLSMHTNAPYNSLARRSIEAAHELGMKSVVVSGSKPAWNFVGADLVVRSLDQLSFMNMKNLFGAEELVQPRSELLGPEGGAPQDEEEEALFDDYDAGALLFDDYDDPIKY